MMSEAGAARQDATRARERGLALLIVLWVVVALSLLVAAFNAAVKSGVSFMGSEVQLSKTEALLDAGAELAAARLLDEEEGRRWVADGRPYRVAFAGAQLAISVRDTSGYIDINKADKKLLMGLLQRYSGSESNAARLVDRILQVRGALAGGKPAQDQFRSDAEPAEREPGDATPFVDVAQLRALPGMTPQIYAAIAPLLTVYSNDGRINPRAAPREVLACIPDLTEDDIKSVLNARADRNQRDAQSGNNGERGGAYLSDGDGPAYRVTVELVRPDGGSGASAIFVVAPRLDAKAPYRLIAKRPTSVGAVGRGGLR